MKAQVKQQGGMIISQAAAPKIPAAEDMAVIKGL
jgi:hypothetical protein